MKVFISWSGEISGKVARILRDWLPYVFPNVQPYVSTEDIQKGKRWGNEIAAELDSAQFGILCITADNISSPWLNFEAGALSKSIRTDSTVHVCPLLFGLEPNEISGPLSQFQVVTYDKEDIGRLLVTMNESAGCPIQPDRLQETFNTWWPKLFEELEGVYHLIKKKIVWAYEYEHLDADLEVKKAGNEGFRAYGTWIIDEGEPPQEKDCDILIYVFGKTADSKAKLQVVMDFVSSAKKNIPLIVYTRYAAGDALLSKEELNMAQKHSGTVVANFPDTLIDGLKKTVQR